MATDEARKRLLGEFAVALVAEHAAWNRLRDHQLGEAERLECVTEWKITQARLKLLARQVRAPQRQASQFHSHPAQAQAQAEASPAVRSVFGRGKRHLAALIAFAVHCGGVVRTAAARFAA